MSADVEQVVLENHERHIALYAKGHYQRKGSSLEYIFQDLKKILGRCFSIDQGFVTDQDVYTQVLEVFFKVTSMRLQHLFWEQLFCHHGTQHTSISLREMTGCLLGYIAICEVKKGNRVLIDLSVPDELLFA